MSENKKQSQRALDFTKFCFAVKAINIFGTVVKYNHYEGLNGPTKMLFNRILTPCLEFEKQLEKGLGKHAEDEEDMNGGLCDLISKIFDASDEERAKFMAHINSFEA